MRATLFRILAWTLQLYGSRKEEKFVAIYLPIFQSTEASSFSDNSRMQRVRVSKIYRRARQDKPECVSMAPVHSPVIEITKPHHPYRPMSERNLQVQFLFCINYYREILLDCYRLVLLDVADDYYVIRRNNGNGTMNQLGSESKGLKCAFASRPLRRSMFHTVFEDLKLWNLIIWSFWNFGTWQRWSYGNVKILKLKFYYYPWIYAKSNIWSKSNVHYSVRQV